MQSLVQKGKWEPKCWCSFGFRCLFVFRKGPSTKRGGCQENQGPTPACLAQAHPLRSRGDKTCPTTTYLRFAIYIICIFVHLAKSAKERPILLSHVIGWSLCFLGLLLLVLLLYIFPKMSRAVGCVDAATEALWSTPLLRLPMLELLIKGLFTGAWPLVMRSEVNMRS